MNYIQQIIYVKKPETLTRFHVPDECDFINEIIAAGFHPQLSSQKLLLSQEKISQLNGICLDSEFNLFLCKDIWYYDNDILLLHYYNYPFAFPHNDLALIRDHFSGLYCGKPIRPTDPERLSQLQQMGNLYTAPPQKALIDSTKFENYDPEKCHGLFKSS